MVAGGLLARAQRPLLRRTSRLARHQGLDRVRAILSFDCDTVADIDVAPTVHRAVRDLGVTPVYAVPGELLARAPAMWSSLARDGSEFMNHGFALHCEIDDAGNYVSFGFYDRMSPAQRRDDVVRGHHAVCDVLGGPPCGFRAPHFGTLRRSHRTELYQLLREFGYRYSSSTMPMRGWLHGPVATTGAGIAELAVSGRPSAPNRVLDSWSFRFAPGRPANNDSYANEVIRLVEGHTAVKAGLLNLYADPSQVVDWSPFFDAISAIAPIAAPSFSAILDDLDDLAR